MKVGIGIPESMHSPDQIFEWVRRVDKGPFSTLGILDRVVYSNYDPLITLAAAASISKRVRLMTEILLSPLRNTTLLAKEVATLDVLSKGRVVLGLGVGTRKDDFTATGATYECRGKFMEEQIRQMRHIWSGQALNESVGPIGPYPVRTMGPEIILGGFAPRAIQRVAHYADGFITALNDLEQIDKTFRRAEQCWQETNRPGKPRLIAQIDIALEAHSVGQGCKNVAAYYKNTPPFDIYKAESLITKEQQLRDTLHAVEQYGADEVMLFTWSSELDQIDRIGALIG